MGLLLNNSNSEVLNRIFSKNTLNAFIQGKASASYVTAVERYIKNEDGTNLQKISEIYSYLCENHRNEYCYKNTLLNTLLVNHPSHSLKNTSALTEITVHKSKPDFVLINGKSVVYEIKTELDNFERLESQLNDYYKAFDNVVVITDKNSINSLYPRLEKFSFAGINVLNDDMSIDEIKPSVTYSENLDNLIMFKILRKYEFESIIKEYFGELPAVSQFEYYDVCFEMIKTLDIETFFNAFKKELKKRCVIIESEFLNLPDELKLLGYFSSLKQKDYFRLQEFLNKPYLHC